jgi:hypothetical protein
MYDGMNRLNGVAPKLEVEGQREWQRGPTAGIEIERGEAEGELRTSRRQGEGKGNSEIDITKVKIEKTKGSMEGRVL